MKNKKIVFITLLAAMMVMTGIVAADTNPKNLESLPASADASTYASAIISNGLIQLGVNDQGHLNIPGGTPSSGSGTTFVGLRFLPTNAEATAPGCLCEGWGAADNITATTGYANVAVDGVVGMTLVSFSNDTTNATSIVNISSTLQVKHFYHPSVSPNLYQTDVSITNIGSASVELLYRRVMDWDIEPTYFDEFVTIQNGSAANISFTSNDGFASANPLSSPTPGIVFPTFTGSFIDAGPQDHGALFDFNFGMLAPGATKNFTTFYGAAGNTSGALSALGVVGAEAYSLGKPNNATTGLPLGEPNTFIFAFKGVGGVPIVPTLGSISGMKFDDLNGNGMKDMGEPGLMNWEINLTNETGVVTTMMTDANGMYNFSDLPDGNYTVGETLQAGWIQTAPAVSVTGSATYAVEISGGNIVADQDFGNQRMPPKAECIETVNPAGKQIPTAGANPKSGQNPDGFYQLLGMDILDPSPMVFVKDTGSGMVFGPYANGTKIKYTEANGVMPVAKPMTGVIDWHIKGTGDAAVYAVNNAGIKSAEVLCKVPPPPK